MRDLIDKRELQDEFAKECRGECGICPHEVWGTCNLINMQPTVEAKEVVHGEWKEATPKGVHSWSKGYARCSVCDETIWSGWEMNFCPNCGADMRTSAE